MRFWWWTQQSLWTISNFVCREFRRQIYQPEVSRFGGCFLTAIKCANKNKFLIMDSDGSHPPAKIPEI